MGIPYPDPRFTDYGDGTVTDNLTRLMWTKDAQQIPRVHEWTDEISTCNNLVFAGYNDWRLPNIRELHSLLACDNAPTTGPPGDIHLSMFLMRAV